MSISATEISELIKKKIQDFDLDTEARETAQRVGINMIRASTVGHSKEFICMLRELIQERMSPDAPRSVVGTAGPLHDICPINCCLPTPSSS